MLSVSRNDIVERYYFLSLVHVLRLSDVFLVCSFVETDIGIIEEIISQRGKRMAS